MGTPRLLVVDDEPFNLEIISEYFDGLGYQLDTAMNGEEAWSLLNGANSYDLIILDRMMPILDGIGLLKRVRADAHFSALPVVMQTAAGAPEQVREGLAAGASYYLTKPYQADSLTTIVRSALEDASNRNALRKRLEEHGDALRLMQQGEFELRSIDEAALLASFLAHGCPRPESAVLGLSELLVNGVEHGNLGITYAEKSQLRRSDTWSEEVSRRMALPENRDKRVRVQLFREPDGVRLIISDDGRGFDWERYLDFDPDRVFDPNGRGIAMARMSSFDTLQYHGCGNRVEVTMLFNKTN